jgi:hypothetical protein
MVKIVFNAREKVMIPFYPKKYTFRYHRTKKEGVLTGDTARAYRYEY